MVLLTSSTSARISHMLGQKQEGLVTAATLSAYKSDDALLTKLVDQNEQDYSQLEEYEHYQQRMIFLNNSSRERLRLQNQILWAVFYTIAAAAFIAFIHHYFPFLIGDNIYTFLETITILIGGIFVFYKYSDYVRRDPTNFYELKLPEPSKAGQNGAGSATVDAAMKGNISDASSLTAQCVGDACCTSGETRFDKTVGKCVRV